MEKRIGLRVLSLFVLTTILTVAAARGSVLYPVVEADFASAGDRQSMDGSTVGLTTNLPGGNWIACSEHDWAGPYVSATWDSMPQDAVNMHEEKTSVAISLEDNGSYAKPSLLRISADIRISDRSGENNPGHTTGLGFLSETPVLGVNPQSYFTGVMIDAENDTLEIWSDGGGSGDPVSMDPIAKEAFHNLSYDIDTVSGEVSNVLFNGTSVAGLSATSFTDLNTAYGGVMVGAGARGYFDQLQVGAIPEPATLLLLGLGGLVLIRRRRI